MGCADLSRIRVGLRGSAMMLPSQMDWLESSAVVRYVKFGARTYVGMRDIVTWD